MKHRTHDDDPLEGRLHDEFQKTASERDLSLVIALYVEYYLNEIVEIKFSDPQIIYDDSLLSSFGSKFKLLQSLGVFTGFKQVKENITLFQGVRNYYAHNLSESDGVPTKVMSRLSQLQFLDKHGKSEKVNRSLYDPKLTLSWTAVSTIFVLYRMREQMIKAKEANKT